MEHVLIVLLVLTTDMVDILGRKHPALASWMSYKVCVRYSTQDGYVVGSRLTAKPGTKTEHAGS
jgi:hypothetical protein